MQAPISSSANWRYTHDLSTQVQLTRGSTYPILAWAGLDVAIAIGLALTSWLAYRRDARAALAATVTATLMCADG